MILADSTQLTSQEILFFALAALTLLVVIGILIQRAATGHREDWMSPNEVRRTYFPTSEEAQQDAEYVPTEEERRSNRKAWTIAIIGMLIISAIYLASGGMR
jgi:uncharacterized membrane protein